MAVILKEDLDAGCKLGIWQITENYDELRAGLTLESEEASCLEAFRNPNRQLEWMSVRNLINDMLGMSSRIIYNAERKPFLLNNSYQISISHSRQLTSILLSRFKRVGIDLEFMSHKISRIADRFIHEREVITDDPQLQQYHLYIHWCAKEALYKICDKKHINFKKNLFIEPFQPEKKGEIKGWVDNIYGLEPYELRYEKREDYVIVWTCK